MRLVVGIIFTLALIQSAPALTRQDDKTQDRAKAEQELKRVQRELKLRQDSENLFRQSAEQASGEVRRLKERLVKAGKSIQAIETRATEFEANIQRLQIIEVDISKNLAEKRQEMANLLATLERLSKRPTALALMKPGEAIDTARSAKLLGSLVPKIEEKAATLRNELVALLEVKEELKHDRESLQTTLASLSKQRSDMEKLRRARLEASRFALKEASKEARAANKLVQQADDLKDLISRLDNAAKKARAASKVKKSSISTGFGLAKGMLSMPAKGKITEYYGARLRVGKSKGIRVITRSEAQVIAPFDGEVVFSGPFRDYGQILIISHGDGYHSLLAGMESAFGGVGEWVLAGEPIGVMKKNTKGGRNAELYIELRYKNAAFNPIPWMAK